MKKAKATAISKSVTALLALSMMALCFAPIKCVNASSWIWDSGFVARPTLSWESPKNNTLYSISMPLQFNLSYPRWEPFASNGLDLYSLDWLSYTIDDSNSTAIATTQGQLCNVSYWASQQFTLDISRIPDGVHNLTITLYMGVLIANVGVPVEVPYTFSPISFQVAHTAPSIQIFQPTNQTYDIDAGIPLIFTVDKSTSWVGYSMDNQENITLSGNTTLTGLTDGLHSLVVYVNDTADNVGNSGTIFFTVNTATPSPSPSNSPTQQQTIEPTPLVHSIPSQNYNLIITIISIELVIAAIAGALVYFKKIKK